MNYILTCSVSRRRRVPNPHKHGFTRQHVRHEVEHVIHESTGLKKKPSVYNGQLGSPTTNNSSTTASIKKLIANSVVRFIIYFMLRITLKSDVLWHSVTREPQRTLFLKLRWTTAIFGRFLFITNVTDYSKALLLKKNR